MLMPITINKVGETKNADALLVRIKARFKLRGSLKRMKLKALI